LGIGTLLVLIMIMGRLLDVKICACDTVAKSKIMKRETKRIM